MSTTNWWESAPLADAAPSAPASSAPASDDWWKSAPVAGQPRGGALQTVGNLAAGAVRGAGSIGATLLAPVDIAKDAIAGKGLLLESNRARRQGIDDALGSLGAQTDSTAYQVGKVGAEIAGTLGVGGALAKPVQALANAGIAARATAPIANALSTGGLRAGNLAQNASLGARTADLGARVAGGAAAGGTSAALVDPESAAVGAGIGAALPPGLAAAGRAGRIVGSVVAPFTRGGVERVVGRALNEFASDPAAAQAALRAAPEVVPGSMPTAAAAAGDVGLAGLQRAVINRSPALSSELAERASTQNDARTRVIEAIAGNPGKIATAQEARDVATAAMRESALNSAGNVPAGGILGSLEQMIAAPGNAGLITQSALRRVRDQIAGNTVDGAINSRALYAVRKDLNDILGGRLQGESGNLRQASGQLIDARGVLDDAMEAAAQRGGANTSWRGYLNQYSQMSRPIEQMEILEDVLKRIQTGSMDTRGALNMSSAKLNNILKNEGAELKKKLTPDQLQTLRNVQADLNASTLANTAGKAVGSNTVQNLGSDQFLSEVLGPGLGGSGLARDTLGRVAGFAARRANTAIEERLGEALLEPQTAALLMDLAQRPDLLQRIGQSQAASIGARAIPAIAAGGQR